MNVVVVFHSVCGNGYLIGRRFAEAFEKFGATVRVLRVADSDFSIWKERFAAVREFAAELETIPVATAQDLLEADWIVLGSPTYYGNVSGEMKIFLDSTGYYYLEQPLLGKKALCFTNSSSNGGGGNFTLDALWRFGQHMGLRLLPVPVSIQMQSPEMSAYGVNHISGPLGMIRPDCALLEAIDQWVDVSISSEV